MILEIPNRLLSKMQGINSKLIWGNKKPRIRKSILEKGLEDGGLAVPNIMKYYHAATLAACLTWWYSPADGMNMQLEQERLKLPLAD